MRLTPAGGGIATVTITATDPGGESATQRFSATVEEPEPTEACTLEDLGTLREAPLTESGTLGRDCVSPNRSGRFARFYTFRLTESAEVQIDLTSSDFDVFLFLREGADVSGRGLKSNDDGGSGTNARITADLSSGTYTIEATSFGRNNTGDFELTVERTDDGGGTTGGTDRLTIDSCGAEAAGSFNVRITIEGTVRVGRRVTDVVAFGCASPSGQGSSCSTFDFDYIGRDSLGTIEAGASKEFRMSGTSLHPLPAWQSAGDRASCWVSTEGRVAGTETSTTIMKTESPLRRK